MSTLIAPYRGAIKYEGILKRMGITDTFCARLKISQTTMTIDALLEYLLSYLFFHYSAKENLEDRAKKWMHITLRPELIKGREQLLIELYKVPPMELGDFQDLIIEDWNIVAEIIQNLGNLPIEKLTGAAKEQFDLLHAAVKEEIKDKDEEEANVTPNDIAISLMTLYLHADETGENLLWTNYWIHLMGFVHMRVQKINTKLKAANKYLADDLLLLVLDQLRAI